ncbi:MAG: hypothetical protein ACTHK4_02535 [Mycobacteriales bacterium]
MTMKFAQLGKNRVALAEKAVDGSGKVIGFDVVNGVFDPNSNTAKDKYVLSTKGGMLYVDFTFKNQPTTHGKVVGGTGRYKDATGTFTGVLANKQGTRAKVTIRYSTPQ